MKLETVSDAEKQSVLADLVSGNDQAIWMRYLSVKLDFDKAKYGGLL
jgi:hypothetical protein